MTQSAHTEERRDPPAAPRSARWLAAVRRVAAVVRRMIGVPDYETYLAHMRREYPGCTPMDLRTFERERLTARYKATGSRCC
ncbi:YbdD/YjiX family protein [Gemmatimonas sp.]|jgi:uncharacterized short protein YbdD (DUF466 family)|uniref:YbdD/YjiX family protein n=1 Tax=Gemmatimonas sp. TaxID=1962908 RepID=UPI0037C128E9